MGPSPPTMIPGIGLASNGLILYFGYLSYKAIESPDPRDDTQWLTFWLIYSVVSFLEMWIDLFFFWVPFYYEIKFVFYIWLGFMNGAHFVYENYLKKLLSENQKNIDAYIAKTQAKIDDLKKDATTAATQKFGEIRDQAMKQVVEGVTSSFTGGAKKEQ